MAAALDPSSSLYQVARSLAQPEIPIKLRCAVCNTLALNAFRLPCCDQSICDSCQGTLPAACPVCEHAPLSAGDCKANKALRTTIKVFLRTEEKKRENSGEKVVPVLLPTDTPNDDEGANDVAATPSGLTNIDGHGRSAENTGSVATEYAPPVEEQREPATIIKTVDEAKDVPMGETQVSPRLANDLDARLNAARATEPTEMNGSAPDAVVGPTTAFDPSSSTTTVQSSRNDGVVPTQDQASFSGGFASNVTGMGSGLPGGVWDGHFGYPPMASTMGNGVGNGQWMTGPNVLGLPGMNMEHMPMAPAMFGGFGGSGGGMNGMSGVVNMNFGMDTGFGHSGGYDTWAEHSGWNVGPNKFNPNAHGNMPDGMGNFGTNMGYPPANNGFGLPAGGRGHVQPRQYRAQNIQTYSRPGPVSRGPTDCENLGENADGRGDELSLPNMHPSVPRPASGPLPLETDAKTLTTGVEETPSGQARGTSSGISATTSCGLSNYVKGDQGCDDHAQVEGGAAPKSQPSDSFAEETAPSMPITDNTPHGSQQPLQAPVGPAAMLRGGRPQPNDQPDRETRNYQGFPQGSSGFRGRGGMSALPATIPTGPKAHAVVGAPTAPKALREGLPNTSIRGRGSAFIKRGGHTSNGTMASMAWTEAATTSAADEEGVRESSRPPRGRSSMGSPRIRLMEKEGPGRRGSDDSSQESFTGGQSARQRIRSGDPEAQVGDASHDSGRRRERPTSRDRQSRSNSPLHGEGRHESEDRSRRDRRFHAERVRERQNRSRRSRSGSDRTDPTNYESGRRVADDNVNAVREDRRGDRRRRREAMDRHGRRRARSRSGSRPRSRSRSRLRGWKREQKQGHREGRASAEPRDRDIDGERLSRDGGREGRGDRDRFKDRAGAAERKEKEANVGNRHDREREARNRERVQKERQRMEALGREQQARSQDRKRGRTGDGAEDGFGEGNGIKRQRNRGEHGLRIAAGGRSANGRGKDHSRRISYKYEDDESHEARACRVEGEREATRWR